MGKIRVKAVGDEELEQQQSADAKKRSDAKKDLRQAETETVDVIENVAEEKAVDAPKKAKKEKFLKEVVNKRSKSYTNMAALVDRTKLYSLSEAVKILPTLKRAKFDETVELHFTLTDGSMSGSVILPHGTGKEIRVAIADGADQKAIDELVKKIESGTVDFDVLIATPDAMPKLAKVARVLGPRGLMPNPKNGTVTPKPQEAAEKFAGGQMNYKSEAKSPLLHVAIGKVSFKENEILANAKAMIGALDKKKLKKVTLKSTMSPALHIDTLSI